MLRKPMTATQLHVAQLERDAGTVKDECRALATIIEEARQERVRGWHQVEAAQAKEHRALEKLEEHLEALASLQREIAALIPRPRPGD